MLRFAKIAIISALVLVLVLLGFVLLLPSQSPEPAQALGLPVETSPPENRHFELRELMRKLNTTARLMHTTAHPDDEDGGMLTLESHGKGASTLLLTLNRGEGGQNKLGSNLLDVLGVLRTLELLESDKYYGVEQRFTRVADFGFSKSAEETFEKWHGHDVALGDMVRVIRTFRPDVLVSRFQGTSKDGHGHHSAAGILTREAFHAAADSNRFPEQIKEGLAVWQPKKLYVDNARPPDEHTLELDTGAIDPLLGVSYAEYAMQGLKHQLSQGAGSWNYTPGPHSSYYKLVDSAIPEIKPGTHESDFFDGLDTSLAGIAKQLGTQEGRVPFLRTGLQEMASQINKAAFTIEVRETASFSPAPAATPLLAALATDEQLMSGILKADLVGPAKATVLAALRTKQEQLQQAVNLALGVELRATVEVPPASSAQEVFVAVPGQALQARLTFTIPEPGCLPGKPLSGCLKITDAIKLKDISFDLPAGWKSKLLRHPGDGELVNKNGGWQENLHFQIDVPANAQLTRPYWYRDNPETDSVYTLDQPQYATLPFPPPPVRAHAAYKNLEGNEGRVEATLTVAFKDADDQEHPMPLAVEPAICLSLEPAMGVVPLSNQAGITEHVKLGNDLPSLVRTLIQLNSPPSWRVEPNTRTIDLNPGSKGVSADFHVSSSSLQPGRSAVSASATAAGRTYSEAYTIVTRPDLGAFPYFQPAKQDISVVDVKIPDGLKVGYVMGAGDDIPMVLKQIGMDVELISDQDLASADLSRFGTIVLGVRAYDTQEGLRKNNALLLEYVKNGGSLLVQYNSGLSDFNEGHYMPYPAELSHDRVTVEEAPVKIIASDERVFHFPNQIVPADFDAWVQERGLYFMSSWDRRYQSLLESHDPGEKSLEGGLLLAHYGKGIYIYCGYSFFRQLPAGVPGAIRLFVNLVSAGHG